MRLSYRGLPYEYEPPSIDAAETQMRGNYRGHKINFSYVRHIPVPQPAQDLQYRGIHYHTTTTGLIQAQLPVAPVRVPQPSPTPAPESRPIRLHKKAIMREVAKVHKENILQRLQHRLDVARQKGDQGLIAQLEKELHQIA